MGEYVARKKRKRRKFSPEFKAEVVELIRTSGRTIGEVAREMDLTATAVREWVAKADEAKDEQSVDDTRTLQAELRAAKKRIRELEEEKLILKKCAALFAQESS